MTRYAAPGAEGAIVSYESRYDHWIGGAYVPPSRGQYFENPSPVNGRPFTEIARGTAEDVELALDAAHAAAPAWGATPAGDRAGLLNRIADRMEAHLEELAVAESWDNGKPVRETLAADIPLAIDHFRYFAGALRAQEGSLGEIDDDTVAYHFHVAIRIGKFHGMICATTPSGSWKWYATVSSSISLSEPSWARNAPAK